MKHFLTKFWESVRGIPKFTIWDQGLDGTNELLLENQISLGGNHSGGSFGKSRKHLKEILHGCSPPGDWKELPPVAAAVATGCCCIPNRHSATAENGRLL